MNYSYWHLRGEERAAARALYESKYPQPLFPVQKYYRGPHPGEMKVTDDAVTVCKRVYYFANKVEKQLAILFATAGIPPLPLGCTIADAGDMIEVIGPCGSRALFDPAGTAVSTQVTYESFARRENDKRANSSRPPADTERLPASPADHSD